MVGRAGRAGLQQGKHICMILARGLLRFLDSPTVPPARHLDRRVRRRQGRCGAGSSRWSGRLVEAACCEPLERSGCDGLKGRSPPGLWLRCGAPLLRRSVAAARCCARRPPPAPSAPSSFANACRWRFCGPPPTPGSPDTTLAAPHEEPRTRMSSERSGVGGGDAARPETTSWRAFLSMPRT